MRSFYIRLIENDETTHIYTDVSKIGIEDDSIIIDYVSFTDGDERAVHHLDMTEEINIKVRR